MKIKIKDKNLGKKLIAITLAIALAISLAACGSEGKGKDAVVAKIGDVEIEKSRVDTITNCMLLITYNMDSTMLPEEEQVRMKSEVLDLILRSETAKIHFGKKSPIGKETEEIASGAVAEINSNPENKALFEKSGITDDTIKDYIYINEYLKAYDNEVSKDGKLPTDKEIEAYYNKNKKDLKETEKKVNVRHILITDEAHTDVNKEKIQTIRDKIVSGEETFEKMVTDFSEDSGSVPAGGEMGFFGKGRMVEQFEEAAFKLNVGDLSEVIETKFGYHILEVLGINDVGHQLTLEDAKETIRGTLKLELFNKKIKALMGKQKVEYLDKTYELVEEKETKTKTKTKK